jgi:hypothetical protein
MNHHTSPKFWECYSKLQSKVKAIADKNFELLKKNPKHPSLHLKKAGRYWSVRAGIFYRALGVDTPNKDGIIWFWIGSHTEYDRLISNK